MERILRRCGSNRMLRHYFKENKNVRWRSGTIRYGASGISLADSWQRIKKYVGAWLVFH